MSSLLPAQPIKKKVMGNLLDNFVKLIKTPQLYLIPPGRFEVWASTNIRAASSAPSVTPVTPGFRGSTATTRTSTRPGWPVAIATPNSPWDACINLQSIFKHVLALSCTIADVPHNQVLLYPAYFLLCSSLCVLPVLTVWHPSWLGRSYCYTHLFLLRLVDLYIPIIN